MAMDKSDAKKMKTYLEELPVPLTRDELLDRGQRLAKVLRDLQEHELHAAGQRLELKNRETKLHEEIDALTKAIHDKAELREVRCEGWIDYMMGTYEEVRTDTGEPLPGTRRHITPEERQASLRLEAKRGPDITLPVPKKKADDA